MTSAPVGESPALLLHIGAMAHVRHAPFRHGFGYRMWMISADLDRLDAPAPFLFGHNRFAPMALHDRDFGPADGTKLAPWARGRLAEAGLAAFGARIRLLCIPRVFGWAFNPIAFWFCHDEAGRLGAVIHEVRNTFGGRHHYLLAVDPPAAPGARARQQAGKRLHVSPFFDLDGGYDFAFRAPALVPGGRFAVVIRHHGAGAARLTATLRLVAAPATAGKIAGLLIRAPLMPVKVVVAIHWQAIRLWWRGAKFHPAPVAQAGARLGS